MTSRLLPSLSALLRVLLLVVIVAVVAIVAKIVLGGGLPSLNPFSEKTDDRTGPSVIRSLNDLSEYRAVTAHQEVVVDLEKGNTRLPAWLSGDRVIYIGKGDVDAIVDFGELDERRVSVSEEDRSVTIRLPAPTVGRTVLDVRNSYVVDHDKGITTRFKGSDLEHEAQVRAVEQMSTDAAREGEIIERAKQNTTAMLRGLLGALGFTSITVTFDEDPR